LKWPSGFCVSDATELQTALTTAAGNGQDDTIQIVQGTYNGNFVYASTEANSLTIEGGYTEDCSSRTIDPENTVIDGGGIDNVLMLVTDGVAANFSVEGLTIRNGRSHTVDKGGGVYVNAGDGELTLRENIFIQNSAVSQSGGGVWCSGSGTFTNNTFTGNSAGYGGGVRCNGSGTFTDNTFTGNSAGYGGGGVFSSGTFTNNTFTENSVGQGDGGGGVYGSGTFTNNTFTGNSAGGRGGGVFSPGNFTNNTFTDNTFTGNSAGYGGGGVSGSGTFTNNTFTENSVGQGDGGGGGVYGSGTFTNNTFTGNSAGYGGGVYCSGSGTFTNNTFTENSAGSNGGGVYCSGSGTFTNTFTDNTFTGNFAGYGGGGVYGSGTFTKTFTNNSFRSNSALTGGAISCSMNSTIINCTLIENTASSQGGGISFYSIVQSAMGRIYNNIIWNNIAPEGSDMYIDNTGDDPFFPAQVELFNNDFDHSASGTVIIKPFPIDPSNVNNVDPLFTGTDNFHLSASSPCINKGSNAAPDLPETDKEGNPRIVDGTVDMGAYEYNSLAPTADAGQDQTVDTTDTVTLDGFGSSDPEGETLTYSWAQVAGTTVLLSYGSAIQPTFIAPERAGVELMFQLTVTNASGLKNTDWVRVNVVGILPAVTTTQISNITATTAVSGGNISSDGGLDVTERGVCWSTTVNPTIANSKTTDGTGAGTFSSSITGLSPGATYHVRAYAINTAGTGYGSDVSFTTSYASTRYVCSDGYCGGKTLCHRTVREAVEAAGTGTFIKIAAEEHNGNFSLSANKALTLQGGWDKTFNNPNGGTTTLQSAPKAPQGSLTFQNLRIVP